MKEISICIKPFVMGTDKECAKKIPEEAAEAFAEWVMTDTELGEISDNRLADELADVIQAACNLADRYDIDLAAAMKRCEERNRARGRY